MSHTPHSIGISNNDLSNYKGPYIICDGEFVTLYASQGTSDQWKINGRNIPSTQGGQSHSILAYQAGVYTCDISGSGGCGGRSNPISININSNPYPLVETNCSCGGSVILTAVTSTGGICYWSNQVTGNPITVGN